MAFGLGQAIADEFAYIAALLRGGGPFSGPGTGGTVGGIHPIPQPPPTPPTGEPPPTPPGTGQPPVSLPPIIDVAPTNIFPAPPPMIDDTQCPILTPGDYLSVVGAQSRAQGGVGPIIDIYTPPGETMGGTERVIGVGVPVEADDYFRFRAYGTASATVVSFFGRVIRPDGVIAPFNHQLTTNSTGTVFQTTPQPGPGILLGAAASVPLNSVTSGSVNAVGEIGRIQAGVFVPHTLLFSGQLSDKQPLSSTLASPAPTTSFPTFKRVTSGGGVAPTISLTVTPTAGMKMRFLFIGVQCTCSAVAFSREAVILIKSGGNTMLNADPATWLSASQSGFLSACMSGQQSTQGPLIAGDNIGLNAPLPESVYFNAAVSVVAGLNTSAAGDIASGLIVNYEES